MKVDDQKSVSLLDGILKAPDSKKQKAGFEKRTYAQDVLDLKMLNYFSELRGKVLGQPSVRVEKVAELKPLVETRTYNMRGEIVAKAIIRSHLLDEIL